MLKIGAFEKESMNGVVACHHMQQQWKTLQVHLLCMDKAELLSAAAAVTHLVDPFIHLVDDFV